MTDGSCNDTLIACYNNRSACYQQLGDYENVVGDATWVLEHDVGASHGTHCVAQEREGPPPPWTCLRESREIPICS